MGDDTSTAGDPNSTASLEASAPLEEKIGPYRILQKIGEGGMGEVYLAQQEKPLRRKVALKIIKRGMDSRQIVGRFEAERQALALMNHPNVAKVYDAGTTPGGRPYFALEYVEGVPITEYCDRHRLTPGERLDLFMQVCEGVQHAHQNAIIHRDIKPSNVLASTQGDRRVTKIIDFGVAKATAQRLTERTVFTELGQLIGTPEYMSPEQAEMTPEAVDTRTDVYSLGVLLYELLVGALPFDPRELRKAGFDEIRRRIREDEPSKPSTRISTLGVASSDSASKRRTDPNSLARLLRGDLDWITMKALDKDRARRYGSPNELAADIRRHLNHEPVEASPPSALYRTTKFMRRHRPGVAVAVAAVLLLVGFAGRERIQANRIAREAATAEQVSEFLIGLFEVSDPGEARGNSITAREILDKGVEEIDAGLVDQPELRARLKNTMGSVYLRLGLYDEAEPLLRQALDTRRDLFGGEQVETLASANNLALLYHEQGRYDEAEPLYLETLESRKRILGDDHPDTLTSMHNLALLYQYQGRHDEAEPLYLETLERRRRVLGGDHEHTLLTENGLGVLYQDAGRYDEAEPLYLKTLETRRRLLGADHPDTLASMGNLAFLYETQSRYDEAEAMYGDTIEAATRIYGDDHPVTLIFMANLASLYVNTGRFEEAEPLILETVEKRRQVLGPEHPDTLGSVSWLAYLHENQGRYDEAEALNLETLEIRRRVLGAHHPETLGSLNNLARMYEAQGRYEEAEPLLLEALETRRRVLGDDHPDTIGSLGSLGELYVMLGRANEAEPLFSEAVSAVGRALPPEHPLRGITMRKNGVFLAAIERYDDSERSLVEAHDLLTATFGADHPQTSKSTANLVELYEAWGKPEKASEWRAMLPADGR